ncbi:MAG: alpha/beta fold hydrolase [Candidatus Limnocylindria bacterium]
MSESGWVETNGARLYCEADGAGTPLVLLHAGIANLRQWDPHVPAFAERYRVIRYDARGYGRTDSEHVAYRNRDDLAAVLDHFGATAAHILGCSRSGAIVIDFAVEHPERVISLTDVAGGLGGYDPGLPPEVTAPGEVMDTAWEKLSAAKNWATLAERETTFWVEGETQQPGRVDPALRALVHDWIYTRYVAEPEEGDPQRTDPPAVERLDRLTMPVLVIYGDLDDAWTNATCRYVAATVPGARLEVFENAAHMLNLEQPERFTRVVLDFLTEVDART